MADYGREHDMLWKNPSKGNGSNNILQHRIVILKMHKGFHYKQYLGYYNHQPSITTTNY